MDYRGIRVEDTFCECTDVFVARLLLTAASDRVAEAEAAHLCGFGIITASSIQGCVEGAASPEETPDGRPGMFIQLNAPVPVGFDAFRRALLERLYIVPHLPTCSVFDASIGPRTQTVEAAAHVGRWGDGYETQDRIVDRDTVRIPIMTGDQQIEQRIGIVTGTDGVLEVFGENVAACLLGAENAAQWILREVTGVAIFNYPIGGISGAKVGGLRYPEEGVTINEPYCPSLRKIVETRLPDDADAVIEFPLIGVDEAAIRSGLKIAIDAFAATPGIVEITAPAFGGAWGGRNLMLCDVLGIRGSAETKG